MRNKAIKKYPTTPDDVCVLPCVTFMLTTILTFSEEDKTSSCYGCSI